MKQLIIDVLNKLRILPIYFSLVEYWHFLKSDVCVISPPKAGRTWLRLLFAFVFRQKFDTEVQLDIHKITETLDSVPNIYFTHDVSDFHKSEQVEKTNWREYSSKKIIFLARDPRDMVVSYYHQVKDREGKFDGSLSDFLRDEKMGVENTISFMNEWYQYVQTKDGAILITYEQMQEDTEQVLERVFKFLELNIRKQYLQEAVKETEFQKMKKMEKKEELDDNRLQPKGGDENERKVRKGKVGGYKEELDAEDIEYLNSKMQELHDGFGYESF